MNSAKNSAKTAGLYRSISSMEPMWPAESSLARLEEKAVELLKLSQKLSGSLHPITSRQIAALLRVMNSYYSNLIEGYVTHPLDLEKAQKKDFSSDPQKRALQKLGTAHIEVQEKYERIVREDSTINISSSEFLCAIHKSFYEKLPEEFRTVRSPDGRALNVIPGKLRNDNVEVGGHIPPAHSSIARFLDRFEEVYDTANMPAVRKIIAAAVSHHRLAWIHPFLDGNGRVVRLYTHLFLIRSDIDGNGLWTLARGLARKREEYYEALAAADATRYNDYDGRGNLSERGLVQFAEFILDVAIDQVQFMSSILNIDSVLDHLYQYAELQSIRGNLDETAKFVLAEVFLRGEVSRSEVPRLTGKSERTAARINAQLAKLGLVTSVTKLSALRLNFPMEAVPIIFPALYPLGA